MRDWIAAAGVLCCLWLVPTGPVAAVPVDSLYEATVPGESTDAGRSPAAAEALRQVIVRVTGRGGAASDPGLQPLVADAAKYVQTYRSVAPGQITVTFDPALVEAALAKAGQRLWGRDRPQFLVIVDGPSATQGSLRRDLQLSGQIRGIPLVFADTRAEPPAAVREGNADALRSVAKTFGADGALVVRAAGSAATGFWTGPAGDGSSTGSIGEIVDALADRLGGVLAINIVDGARILVVVQGVNDLASFVSAVSELGRLPAIRGVAVDSVAASTLKLRVLGSVDAAMLRKAARDSGHFEVGDVAGPREIDLVYRP